MNTHFINRGKIMSTQFLIFIYLLIGYAIAGIGLVHCLLRTKYPQAALGWLAAIILVPYLGAFAYYLFGMNRVDSRAGKLMFAVAKHRHKQMEKIKETVNTAGFVYAFDENEHKIVQVGAKKTPMPRQGGNAITPLYNGDHAYPAMLAAIKAATQEVYLCTYIFKGQKYAKLFADALIDAHKRGIDVRIIVDGLGGMKAFKVYEEMFNAQGIPLEKFIPLKFFPPQFSVNLRIHRKLLLCDNIAFTGGMNISDDNVLADNTSHPIQDLHFKCYGSIVLTLREAFLLDWTFLTGKTENSSPPKPACCGSMDARLIMDGPGSAEEPIQNVICGVIGAAKHSITIFTPYFLPTRELIISLGSAAGRGINVRVVLPEVINHAFVGYAAEHMLPPILQSGVQVYRQPAPFAHTKLILIDDMYTFLGSTNLDPRSLSLNFELNMEVFSYELNGELREYAEKIIAKSKLVSPKDYNFKNSNWKTLIVRLKNAAAWVISPYL